MTNSPFHVPEGFQSFDENYQPEPYMVARKRQQASRFVLWLMLMACAVLVAIFAATYGAVNHVWLTSQWTEFYFLIVEVLK